MKTVNLLRQHDKTVTVLAFALACLVGFAFLWAKGGGTIPVLHTSPDYQVSFVTDDIKNLHAYGDVRIAGVAVGKVEQTDLDNGRVQVRMALDPDAAPLHQGASVRIGVKSLVGSSFIDVVDGKGPEIANGAHLPDSMVVPAVDVDELLDTLDPATRAALSKTVRSLARATAGTGPDVDKVMTGLGSVGDEGFTAADALAAQSKDLQKLTGEAARLLDALDTGRGQIADLVTDARTLTSATAAKSAAVRSTVESLPSLLSSVEGGANSLHHLAGSVAPIARDLRAAAPDLDKALVNLPSVTNDLHGLLPSLDGTLDAAPATLSRVQGFDSAVRNLIPDTSTLLRDVDPMLSYLAPYGLDLGALFSNFGATFEEASRDGVRPIRLTATAEGLGTIRGNPIDLSLLRGLLWNNPYPAPMSVDDPKPFSGPYPRVERAK